MVILKTKFSRFLDLIRGPYQMTEDTGKHAVKIELCLCVYVRATGVAIERVSSEVDTRNELGWYNELVD